MKSKKKAITISVQRVRRHAPMVTRQNQGQGDGSVHTLSMTRSRAARPQLSIIEK